MATQSSTLPPRPYESAEPPAALPDFCSVRVVFTVVVCTELLAFVLALALPAHDAGRWATLGLLSLFVQWVALSCTVLLCLSRRGLERLGEAGAGIAAWLLIMAVTAVLSALAYHITTGAGLGQMLHDGRQGDFVLRALCVAGILGAVVLRYFYVQAQNRRRLAAEARARLQALQARIRPHFMFNALNTIASLTRSRPEVAEEMVEDLAELLRASLGEASRPATLAGELDLALRYLHMESLRMGDRLRCRVECGGLPGDARVPPLILQPLVENAVYHGVEPLPGGGEIVVAGACRDGAVTITVSNPRVSSPQPARHQGHHMALDNIRERLRLYYGARARVEVEEGSGSFRVSLSFPLRGEEP